MLSRAQHIANTVHVYDFHFPARREVIIHELGHAIMTCLFWSHCGIITFYKTGSTGWQWNCDGVSSQNQLRVSLAGVIAHHMTAKSGLACPYMTPENAFLSTMTADHRYIKDDWESVRSLSMGKTDIVRAEIANVTQEFSALGGADLFAAIADDFACAPNWKKADDAEDLDYGCAIFGKADFRRALSTIEDRHLHLAGGCKRLHTSKSLS